MNLLLDIWKDSMDGGSARHKASIYTGRHNTEKRGHTSMTRVGFEPTILVFERSKTVRDLDRAAMGTGCLLFNCSLSVSLPKPIITSDFYNVHLPSILCSANFT
jgi:hypothetical protein